MCARTWTYLLSVKDAVSNSSNVSGGLRPTEIRLRSGCIEEIEANYKGDLVSDVLASIPGGDECCQACRSASTFSGNPLSAHPNRAKLL